MTNHIASLSEFLDPVEPDTFSAEYFHRQPLHIRGRPDKFRSVLTWDDINRMLVMDVWTSGLNRPCSFSSTHTACRPRPIARAR